MALESDDFLIISVEFLFHGFDFLLGFLNAAVNETVSEVLVALDEALTHHDAHWVAHCLLNQELGIVKSFEILSLLLEFLTEVLSAAVVAGELVDFLLVLLAELCILLRDLSVHFNFKYYSCACPTSKTSTISKLTSSRRSMLKSRKPWKLIDCQKAGNRLKNSRKKQGNY